MCFATTCHSKKKKILPHYLDDGSVNVDNSYSPVTIPEDVLNHSDHPFIHMDIANGLLGFVYESGYKIVFVYLTEEEPSPFEQDIESSDEDDNPFAYSQSDIDIENQLKMFYYQLNNLQTNSRAEHYS